MKLISPNQNRGSNLADLASNTSLQCFAARETTVPTKKTENGTSMTKTKIVLTAAITDTYQSSL